ncbi:MAG: phosphomannomutase/phosphoglucomutase [Moraxellaceae bacterium]|nr:phosphomannomutase/phosphoglucomutase [Moraxellaceae bacterium]MCP5176337.1 phosphomannomutase/phosphoglucomutase [Moraxellaceae bacterium]
MAKQKSVFKMAMPFVIGITVLVLVIIAVIGAIAITDQKNQQQQEAKQYEQRAVDVVNNFLEQQDAFAKQLASQPSEIIVGAIPGTVLAQVVLTGDEETPKKLSFSNQDLLRRAAAQGGNVAPEMSVDNNVQILAMVKPLADGKGLLLINTPFDFLRKSLEGFSKKEGGKIKLVQKLTKDGSEEAIINLNADALNSETIKVNNPNWYLKIEAPVRQGKVYVIVGVLFLFAVGVVVAMVRLVKKFDHTLNQDMNAIQSILKGETPATPLNFELTKGLHGTLVSNPVIAASIKQEEAKKSELDELASIEGSSIEMTNVDINSLKKTEEAAPQYNQADVLELSAGNQRVEVNATTVEAKVDTQSLEYQKMQLKLAEEASIPSLVFRAYDIRGKAYTEISTALAKQVGLAVGSEARQRGEQTIFVGRDARLSSADLQKELVAGLQESGCDVVDVGQVPSPVLYYAAKTFGSGSGVMVTASHNPAPDNGFKIMLAHHTLVDTEIAALRQRILDKDFSKGKGSYVVRDVNDDYLQAVHDDIILARDFNVVVDAGNGIAGPIAVKMLKDLGCTVSELYCTPDGNFPNHDPDPSKLANLDDLLSDVAISGADLGLAFDGDGDRVVVVTNSTKVIASDKLLMLFAKELLATQPGADILFDVKCSRDLVTVITSNGGRPIMTKTGHSFLKLGLEQTGALLAGEMSGHFFFKDRWGGFDDGLYAAARFLEILANQFDSTADDLFTQFPERCATPEIQIPVDDAQKVSLINTLIQQNKDMADANVNTTDGLRIEFAHGWGVVRASNTGSYLVARFEANTEDDLQQVKSTFKELLQKADPMMLISL